MPKKTWLYLAVAAALAAIYVIFFTEWFRPTTVEIFHTVRSIRSRARAGTTEPSLIFGLNRQLRLTEVEVVPLAEWQTNRNVLPLWHLVSDSNSVPVKSFFYGQQIRGLKPAVKGTRPQPLGSNVVYQLTLKAGPVTAEHHFELK